MADDAMSETSVLSSNLDALSCSAEPGFAGRNLDERDLDQALDRLSVRSSSTLSNDASALDLAMGANSPEVCFEPNPEPVDAQHVAERLGLRGVPEVHYSTSSRVNAEFQGLMNLVRRAAAVQRLPEAQRPVSPDAESVASSSRPTSPGSPGSLQMSRPSSPEGRALAPSFHRLSACTKVPSFQGGARGCHSATTSTAFDSGDHRNLLAGRSSGPMDDAGYRRGSGDGAMGFPEKSLAEAAAARKRSETGETAESGADAFEDWDSEHHQGYELDLSTRGSYVGSEFSSHLDGRLSGVGSVCSEFTDASIYSIPIPSYVVRQRSFAPLVVTPTVAHGRGSIVAEADLAVVTVQVGQAKGPAIPPIPAPPSGPPPPEDAPSPFVLPPPPPLLPTEAQGDDDSELQRNGRPRAGISISVADLDLRMTYSAVYETVPQADASDDGAASSNHARTSSGVGTVLVSRRSSEPNYEDPRGSESDSEVTARGRHARASSLEVLTVDASARPPLRRASTMSPAARAAALRVGAEEQSRNQTRRQEILRPGRRHTSKDANELRNSLTSAPGGLAPAPSLKKTNSGNPMAGATTDDEDWGPRGPGRRYEDLASTTKPRTRRRTTVTVLKQMRKLGSQSRNRRRSQNPLGKDDDASEATSSSSWFARRGRSRSRRSAKCDALEMPSSPFRSSLLQGPAVPPLRRTRSVETPRRASGWTSPLARPLSPSILGSPSPADYHDLMQRHHSSSSRDFALKRSEKKMMADTAKAVRRASTKGEAQEAVQRVAQEACLTPGLVRHANLARQKRRRQRQRTSVREISLERKKNRQSDRRGSQTRRKSRTLVPPSPRIGTKQLAGEEDHAASPRISRSKDGTNKQKATSPTAVPLSPSSGGLIDVDETRFMSPGGRSRGSRFGGVFRSRSGRSSASDTMDSGSSNPTSPRGARGSSTRPASTLSSPRDSAKARSPAKSEKRPSMRPFSPSAWQMFGSNRSFGSEASMSTCGTHA